MSLLTHHCPHVGWLGGALALTSQHWLQGGLPREFEGRLQQVPICAVCANVYPTAAGYGKECGVKRRTKNVTKTPTTFLSHMNC
jgi:hypothetical protein